MSNYTEVDISDSYRLVKEGKLGINLTSKIDPFTMTKLIFVATPFLVEAQLKSPSVKHFLR